MPIQLTAHINRTIIFAGSLKTAAGLPAALASQDVLRIKIGRPNQQPILDLSTGAPSANGSTLIVTSLGDADNAATFQLRLVAADTMLFSQSGFTVEVLLVDSSDDFATKEIDRGTITFQATMTGAVGV